MSAPENLPHSAREGRIPCINPSCRRTAPADRYEAGIEIVCSKCWKLLPKALTDRYRALRRREKRLLSLIERRIAKRTVSLDQVTRLRDQMERRHQDCWRRIHFFFLAPSKPEGLDRFLEEMHLS